MELTGLLAHRMMGCQNRMSRARAALRRTDIANPAVAMINVLPAYKLSCLGYRLCQIGKSLSREFWVVLRGAK